jgi:hypothetical protein
MSLIQRCQKQMLVYWPRIGTEVTGEAIYGAPSEYTCRWDSCIREIQSPTATRIISKIQIISEIQLEIGGLVRLGTLADTAFWDHPKRNSDVHEILEIGVMPNLRNTETLYEAYA